MPDNNAMPTIGRRVYFWPYRPADLNLLDYRQPFDAGVVFVHGPGQFAGRVNLLVTDHLGQTHARLNVPFGSFERPEGGIAAEDHAAISDAGGYADWMPYQKGASHTAPPGTKLI